jgi:hypothetical protein
LEPSEYGRKFFGNKLDTKYEEEVEVKTIASVFEKCVEGIDDPRVYLKIDAQGYDMKVINGTRDVMDTILAFQTELAVNQIYEGMPNYRECIDTFNMMDYAISGIFPVRLDHNMKLIEMDCIMVRNHIFH